MRKRHDGAEERVLGYGRAGGEEWYLAAPGVAINPLPIKFDNVFVWNDKGYFAARLEGLGERAEVRLRPWRSIRGRILIGGEPAPEGTIVGLRGGVFPEPAETVAYLDSTRTDAEGRFTFDRVPEGRFQIHRMTSDRAMPMPTHPIYVDVRDADVNGVTMGDDGRTVRGRLVLPEGVSGEVRVVRMFPLKDDQEPFYPTIYVGSVDAEDSFDVHDVPPGDYGLGVSLRPDGQTGDLNLITLFGERFVQVPPAEADTDAVDWGDVRLRALKDP